MVAALYGVLPRVVALLAVMAFVSFFEIGYVHMCVYVSVMYVSTFITMLAQSIQNSTLYLTIPSDTSPPHTTP